MNQSLTIRVEEERDYRAVEELIRESFWNVYQPGCVEHYLIHTLRNHPDFIPELSFVMEKDGRIIGQNLFAHAELAKDDGTRLPVTTMGPICIANDLKRKGYGKILLDYTLQKAREAGCKAICIEGNIDFYGKCGFVQASTKGLRYDGIPEGQDAPFFLCRELEEGYLDRVSGVYAPPKSYLSSQENPEDFARFDATFPRKEKLVLPGQIF